MEKKRIPKTSTDYWRITLYLDSEKDYDQITAAAKNQRLSASKWLLKHGLRLARRELLAAQKSVEAQ